MNRKKKINQIYQSRAKKINAKLNTQSKPKYICKADRAKLDNQSNQDDIIVSDNGS